MTQRIGGLCVAGVAAVVVAWTSSVEATLTDSAGMLQSQAMASQRQAALYDRKAELLLELQSLEEAMKSGGSAPSSCKVAGCTTFIRGASCQCTPKCGHYNNCCPDYIEECEKPTSPPTPAPPFNTSEIETPCLCAFDIDRTLTAGQREYCPSAGHTSSAYIWDNAYGGGRFRTSEVGSATIAKTACAKCFVGIVSRGDAAGRNSPMRKFILENVIQTDIFKRFLAAGRAALEWTDWGVRCQSKVSSPFVVRSPNECKKNAVEAIRQWYASKGVDIAKKEVYFFDDHSSNIPYFKGTGFNAFEIGCSSHAHSHTSRCGATLDEIRLEHLKDGFKMCN